MLSCTSRPYVLDCRHNDQGSPGMLRSRSMLLTRSRTKSVSSVLHENPTFEHLRTSAALRCSLVSYMAWKHAQLKWLTLLLIGRNKMTARKGEEYLNRAWHWELWRTFSTSQRRNSWCSATPERGSCEWRNFSRAGPSCYWPERNCRVKSSTSRESNSTSKNYVAIPLTSPIRVTTCCQLHFSNYGPRSHWFPCQ